MANELLTIGYEGLDLDAFMAVLREAGVATVIDVRAVARSRKPGFSKRAFSERLTQEGMGYLHLPALGNPPAGREVAKSGDQVGFLEIYFEHLETAEAQAALVHSIEAARTQRAVLMCMERQPGHCHRVMVAAAIARVTGQTVHHLRPGEEMA